MLPREQVIGQRSSVCQALQDDIEVAGAAQVVESCSGPPLLPPVHANLLGGEMGLP